jgi:hypothetical protein
MQLRRIIFATFSFNSIRVAGIGFRSELNATAGKEKHIVIQT